jgi:hypothetical protein
MDDDLNIHTVPSLYKTWALGQNDAKFSPVVSSVYVVNNHKKQMQLQT